MKIYDMIGIGFGPANIALAIALEEFAFPGTRLFLERRPGPAWQPDMLLPGSDIQNHPCRDLVTPRDPRSRYTFMNFLVENNRLFEHLNVGLEFPLRYEYAQYISWVAQFFAREVQYGTAVTTLECDPAEPGLYLVTTEAGETFRARSVVVAPGRTPLLPPAFDGADPERVFHLTQFMRRIDALAARAPLRNIAVVGGSQSAAELVLYLRDHYPDATVHNVMRGYGYRLKDTSQFSEHVYFPAFVDYYYNLPGEGKRALDRHLHYTNYSSVDKDVITHLYAGMYEDRLRGRERIVMHASHDIVDCNGGPGTTVVLRTREVHTGAAQTLDGLDAVVLATGFRNLGTGAAEENCPAILDRLYPQLAVNQDGVLDIGRDYSLRARPGQTLPPVYLNGLCESSHGYGDAGSFSLLALRAADIYRSLNGRLNAPAPAQSIQPLAFA
jgi:L-ornithine N5-oxygenase